MPLNGVSACWRSCAAAPSTSSRSASSNACRAMCTVAASQWANASSGNSFVHETEGQLILSGSYDVGFTMDLACKDLGFALAMGRAFGVPLELAGLVEQTFIRARQQLGGGAWSTAVVKLLEDALHEPLRAPGFPATLEPS